jgi:hypothetical protein
MDTFKLPTTEAENTEAWRRVGVLLDASDEERAIAEARALVRGGFHAKLGGRTVARDVLIRLAPILAKQAQLPRAIRAAAGPPTAADLHALAAYEIAAFYAAKGGRGPDVFVRDFDTVVFLIPLGDDAREWCVLNLPAGVEPRGGGYLVEAHLVPGIVTGLEAAGHTVRGDERAEARGLTRVGAP